MYATTGWSIVAGNCQANSRAIAEVNRLLYQSLFRRNGVTTKLIVADLNQSYNQEGLEPQNLRKICFEIPTYYSLEEFLSNDGLYQLVQSGRVNLNRLNYYEVTPVGKADMSTDSSMQTYVAIGNNSPEALAYADKKLTKDWVEQINRDRKEQVKLRKQANKKMVDEMYEQALIDEENFENQLFLLAVYFAIYKLDIWSSALWTIVFTLTIPSKYIIFPVSGSVK